MNPPALGADLRTGTTTHKESEVTIANL